MKNNALAFFLTFFAFTSYLYKNVSSPDLIEIFKISGIEIKKVCISGWAKFEGNLDIEKSKLISEKIASELEASFDEDFLLHDSDSQIKKVYKGDCDKGSIILTLECKYDEILKKYESIIIIEMTQYGKFWNITDYGERLTKCLNGLGTGPPAGIYVEGYIKGHLEKKKREKIIENIIKSIEAVKVEGIDTENIVSVYGYTEKIRNYIKLKNRKININIASRFSPWDENTYFWLGTPLLNMDY